MYMRFGAASAQTLLQSALSCPQRFANFAGQARTLPIERAVRMAAVRVAGQSTSLLRDLFNLDNDFVRNGGKQQSSSALQASDRLHRGSLCSSAALGYVALRHSALRSKTSISGSGFLAGFPSNRTLAKAFEVVPISRVSARGKHVRSAMDLYSYRDDRYYNSMDKRCMNAVLRTAVFSSCNTNRVVGGGHSFTCNLKG
ncbi:hypothetical protein PC118_g8676 [Phytophthora cactorum]|uniref:Uncharacterized protein n=1 Tax=Phytophthora cactorum TaxID=29920 RepID=A0A8T1CK59_9STRA|nr:hypothetical protein PC111_g8011 [Phytophthora cactorum]KAG2858853.1 hypothetical protein PC113_g9457 [Phytophthora cactorum]KAG2924941.1 hypothetical protein PC115_g8443 [Phytophthora cactorum]KAG2984804.1 hypothetical protein PC118_g8676 [Phytophthora cactorum]KAG3021851.1 hypothetical protein PC119_g9470 [Phytophthora cactorum]